MPLYMEINDVKGSVSTQGFSGAILLHGMQQQGSRVILQSPGMGTQREVGMPTLAHIRIIKSHDAASAQLRAHFCAGKSIEQVNIYQCILSKDSADWHAKTILYNVIISSLQEMVNSDGGEEILELAYTKIEKGYRQQDAQGQLLTPHITSYDITTASVA